MAGMAALRQLTRLAGPALYARPARPLAFQTRGLATAKPPSSVFAPLDSFAERHIGPDDHEVKLMLDKLGYDSMDAFVGGAVPGKIRVPVAEVSDESIPALSEAELHKRAKELGRENSHLRSYIGMGYHNAVVPPVILRNVRTPFDRPVPPSNELVGHRESCLVYPVYSLST